MGRVADWKKRNLSGTSWQEQVRFIHVWRIQVLYGKQLKTTAGKKKKEYVTHTMGHYPRNV